MKASRRHFTQATLALLTATALASCTKPYFREEVATRIAAPAWMVERQIAAGPFALTAFERMHERYAPANVYIEGDGVAWLSKKRPSMDPTPKNPVALHLASRDKAENVVYLARPCQFSKMVDPNQACDQAYWTGKRYAPEIVASYNEALDEIRRRYNIEGFNLIGFSGGGTLAALLAAEREDVLSFRTVAGNLDHRAHSDYHEVSYLSGSLNPPEFAAKLARVPQNHFIGGQDEIVPPTVLHSYLQAVGESNCIQYQFIQEAEHEKGWVDKWPELLKIPAECRGPIEDLNLEFIDLPEPIYSPRETPSKP